MTERPRDICDWMAELEMNAAAVNMHMPDGTTARVHFLVQQIVKYIEGLESRLPVAAPESGALPTRSEVELAIGRLHLAEGYGQMSPAWDEVMGMFDQLYAALASGRERDADDRDVITADDARSLEFAIQHVPDLTAATYLSTDIHKLARKLRRLSAGCAAPSEEKT